jgi:predicted MPP superfamily phosphohydrolase
MQPKGNWLNIRNVFILIICVAVYAVIIEPRWLYVNFQDMRLDKTLDSIRVVHLSDLHINKIGKREDKVIEIVKALKPDLIVFSGDVIDKADHLPTLHSFLAEFLEIKAIAVLGNWEYWSGVDIQELYKEYQHHNIRLLVNDVASYKIRQRSIQVIGIDDFTAGEPNFDLVQYPIGDDLAILVQHSPAFFDHLPTNSNTQLLDLCLAGHTHGGQVTLFGRPIWMPPGSGTFASGQYHTAACELFVSKGIGTSILPIRFWARPEIAAFDL